MLLSRFKSKGKAAHMQESVDYSSVPDWAALSRPGPCSFPLRPFAMAISPNPALWAYFEGNAVAIDFESCTFGCFCRIWLAVMIPDSCAKCTSFGPGPTLSLGPGPVTIVRHGFFGGEPKMRHLHFCRHLIFTWSG